MKKRLLAMILAVTLFLPPLPALNFTSVYAAGTAIDVVVNFFRQDGNYRDDDVWVGNFGGAPASTDTTWSVVNGWRQARFNVSGVNAGEFIAFQLMNDSVFPNDLRYIDPWGADFDSPGTGADAIEIWLIDGDARAYAAPISVPAAQTRDIHGVTYINVDILPTLLTGTGVNRLNELEISRPLNAGFLFDGAPADSVRLITIMRGGIEQNGIANVGRDRIEINPLTNRVIYNRSGQMAGAPISAVAGFEPNEFLGFRTAEIWPVAFQDIQGFLDGTNPETDNYYLSLGSIRRMLQTVSGLRMGTNTYLLPRIFVAYDDVQNFTGRAGSVGVPEDVGFCSEALAAIGKHFQDQIDAGLSGGIGYAIVMDGKLVKEAGFGYGLQYQTQPIIEGGEVIGHTTAMLLPRSQWQPVTEDTLFDLASNSKMYATVLAVQSLVSQGLIDLDAPLSSFPGWERYKDENTDWTGFAANAFTGKEYTTIRQILNHDAGLRDFHFFRATSANPAFNFYHSQGSYDREAMIEAFVRLPLARAIGSGYVYTDTAFMILGILVEQITGMRLDEYVDKMFGDALGLNTIVYNPLHRGFLPSDVAATEISGNSRDGTNWNGRIPVRITPAMQNSLTQQQVNNLLQTGRFTLDQNEFEYERAFFRGYTIQGEVHDENTFYPMEGVSGHAGLFGSASDMARIQTLVLNGGVFRGQQMFTREVMHEFHEANLSAGAMVGLGWRRNVRYNQILGSKSWGASASAFGHTGWTGTNTLNDPVYNMSITFLGSHRHSQRTGQGENWTNTGFPAFGNVGVGIAAGTPGVYQLANGFAFAALNAFDPEIGAPPPTGHMVTFNTDSSFTVPAQVIADGETAQRPTVNPGRIGSTFRSWYADAALATPFNFSAQITSDTTIYAGWDRLWRAYFVLNGGTMASGHHFMQIVYDGNNVVQPPDPTRGAFSFTGWFADPGLTVPFDFNTPVDHWIVIYAGWENTLAAPTIPMNTPAHGANPQERIRMAAVAVNAAVPLYHGEIVQWFNITTDQVHTGPFAGGNQYRATITLTSGAPRGVPQPNAWYRWPAEAPEITIQDNGINIEGVVVSDAVVTGGDINGNVVTFNVTFPKIPYEAEFGFHIFNNGPGGTPSTPNASLAEAGLIRMWTQLDGENALVPYADLEVTATLPGGQSAMEFIRIHRIEDNVISIDADKNAPWQRIYFAATLSGQSVEIILINALYEPLVFSLHAYNNGTDLEVPSMAGNIRIWPLLNGSSAPIPMTAVITALDQDSNDAMQFVTKNRQWTDAGWRDYYINFDVTKDAPWETILFTVTVYNQTVTLLLINDWFTGEPEPKPIFGLRAFNNGTDTQVPSLAGTIRIWTQLDDVNALVPFADLEVEATLLDGTCAMEFVRTNRIWNNPDYVNLFDVSKNAEWQYINFSVTLFSQTVELILINDRYGT